MNSLPQLSLPQLQPSFYLKDYARYVPKLELAQKKIARMGKGVIFNVRSIFHPQAQTGLYLEGDPFLSG
jgi:hypothetical protein